MRIEVLTIFPQLLATFAETSLIGRAVEGGLLSLTVHDLRDFAQDRHHTVDDTPYGGGGGMVMKVEPWVHAVRSLSAAGPPPHRVLLSPQGRRLDDALVRELSQRPRLLLLCGRYEGIDERVSQLVVDEELSIGDYVLSGGELPAMVVIEAVSRQIPGVVKLRESVENDSFRTGILDYPHYTRPPVFEGMMVPEVLLSGNHAEIETWRLKRAREFTRVKRPDLMVRGKALGALKDEDS